MMTSYNPLTVIQTDRSVVVAHYHYTIICAFASFRCCSEIVRDINQNLYKVSTMPFWNSNGTAHSQKFGIVLLTSAFPMSAFASVDRSLSAAA